MQIMGQHLPNRKNVVSSPRLSASGACRLAKRQTQQKCRFPRLQHPKAIVSFSKSEKGENEESRPPRIARMRFSPCQIKQDGREAF